MAKTVMKCGHPANAVNSHNKPVCAICIGITAGAEEIDDTPPSLEGRMAQCVYCGSRRPSSYDLPFFSRGFMKRGVEDDMQDSFYDGCRGWD